MAVVLLSVARTSALVRLCVAASQGGDILARDLLCEPGILRLDRERLVYHRSTLASGMATAPLESANR